jgi:hypothetical protein
MSSKQIARAAVDRRRLRFNLYGNIPVEGYVVGMDDYHWLISSGEDPTMLVHKGSTMTVEFLERFLSEELESLQKRVIEIGQAFWDSQANNTTEEQTA